MKHNKKTHAADDYCKKIIEKHPNSIEAADKFKTATPSDIVNALIEKVFVFPNNHIEIRWKFANFAEAL